MQPMLDTSHLPPVPEWHKAGEFTDIVYELSLIHISEPTRR